MDSDFSLFISSSPTHRLTKVRHVDFELAACDVIACPDHPEKQWLALAVIANHLGSSLQEFTIHLVWCGFPRHLDGPVKDTKWVKGFAEEKSRMGTNICIVWRQVEDEILRHHPDHQHVVIDYYWAAQRSDMDLLDFFIRTFFGHCPLIRIWTHPPGARDSQSLIEADNSARKQNGAT